MKGFLRFCKRLFIASLVISVLAFGYLISQERTDSVNEPPEELLIGGANKYYFNRLSELEKRAYNSILTEIGGYPPRIKVPAMTKNELGNVFEALLYDNPEFYFTGRECTVRFSGSRAFFYPEYAVDDDVYAAQMTAVENAAQSFLSTVSGITDEYSLELAVHDYLVSNCSYNEDNATIYDALVRGVASCEGYSKAAKYLFDKLGIKCYVMCGVAENHGGETVDHMWNVVNIGGGWYNLDITWDDPADANDRSIRHTYFNISDAQIAATHSRYQNDNKCVETEQCYFKKSGILFSAYDTAAEEKIARLIADAADAGEDFTEFKFSAPQAYVKAHKALFKDKQVYKLQERASDICTVRINPNKTSYASDEKFNIIQIYISYS